ncbi:MAG: hypothetical protein HKN63_00635 [Rhodobacteraceae bacterium]|nr:hypothetical protein [Paracoccaceae bacterium]
MTQAGGSAALVASSEAIVLRLDWTFDYQAVGMNDHGRQSACQDPVMEGNRIAVVLRHGVDAVGRRTKGHGGIVGRRNRAARQIKSAIAGWSAGGVSDHALRFLQPIRRR